MFLERLNGKFPLSFRKGGSCLVAMMFLVGGCAAPSPGPERAPGIGIFDVRDYGAVGYGAAPDTKAIQAAIDDCARVGGGKVCLNNGRFLSGTIYLKSNVTLYVEAGATLLGSTDVNDYPVIVPKCRSYTDYYVEQSLIYAASAENIGIAGQGVIDGQGGTICENALHQEGQALYYSVCRVPKCPDNRCCAQELGDVDAALSGLRKCRDQGDQRVEPRQRKQ